MYAAVRVQLPDGSTDHLVPGDLIGRTWTAALRLDDPHVSEAHALVSLRGESLVLLSLRRRFLVDGHPADQVELAPGQRLRFSPESEIVVLDVTLPGAVLALEGPGLPTQTLVGPCSLVCAPHLRLTPGVAAGALAVLWNDGEGWRARIRDGAPVVLRAGSALQVDQHLLRVVSVPLSRAGQAQTRANLDAPLTITAYFDTVHLARAGAQPVVVSGLQARVLSELVATRAPLGWEDLAAGLWPEIPDRDALRRRWDVLMVRLRGRLREAGVRPDLIQSTGVGLVELVLRPDDRIEDRT